MSEDIQIARLRFAVQRQHWMDILNRRSASWCWEEDALLIELAREQSSAKMIFDLMDNWKVEPEQREFMTSGYFPALEKAK